MSEEQLGSLAATVEDAVPDPAVAVPDQAVGANAGLDPAVGENAVPDPEVGEIRIARPDSGPDLYVLIVEVRPAYVQALLCDEQVSSPPTPTRCSNHRRRVSSGGCSSMATCLRRS